MICPENVLKYDERAVLGLRALFEGYGYVQYRMGKFEEYDLYVRNKDFLISDSVITFTDTTGQLMALKPDVTLSIIKNGRDLAGAVQKVYYDENVYRVSGASRTFREIRQFGAECIGDISMYDICETVLLAARSLQEISGNAVLDISHLGFISAVLDAAGVPEEIRPAVMGCIGEKNLHELADKCAEIGLSDHDADLLQRLITVYGTPQKVLPILDDVYGGIAAKEIGELRKIVSFFRDEACAALLNIDFSTVSDIKYYNGIVFKGFVAGIPERVLSGGQYDRLMRKMGRNSGAIGFAVYLDLLQNLAVSDRGYDTDILILYDGDTDPLRVKQAAEEYIAQGLRVTARRCMPEDLTFRSAVQIKNGEAEDNGRST